MCYSDAMFGNLSALETTDKSLQLDQGFFLCSFHSPKFEVVVGICIAFHSTLLPSALLVDLLIIR